MVFGPPWAEVTSHGRENVVRFSTESDFLARHHIHIASGAHTSVVPKVHPVQRGLIMKVGRSRLDGCIGYFHQIINFCRYLFHW